MAGGNETPRQKMIGMMYLVLTALLALQVSNAVLEKFAIIYETLEELSHATNNKNAQTLQAIIAEAGKAQKPQVVRAKENAQKIRELTATTLAAIDNLKKEMKAKSGTQEIDEKLINDHSSKVATMMVSGPEGKNFEKLLNDYVKQLITLSGMEAKEFPTLAKAPKDIPAFAGDEDHANKDFLTFTFENTPVIAALASVTQMETEILEYETKALNKLLEDAGIGKVSFDNIVPMVRAQQAVVAAGATYEADLFISASSSAFTPEMYMNGKPLELFDDVTGVKMGKIKFTAQGGGYNAQGFATKSYETEIHLPDTVLKQTIEYTVAQPTIKVTTGNAPTLYMNCGNNVTIEVPQLGSAYNPAFRADGADIIRGSKPGQVTIVPKQRRIEVAVSSGGTPIGTQRFDVRPIPPPRYLIKDNTGREVDKKNGVRGSSLTSLRVEPDPEENFKTEVPNDARYIIQEMEVIHARGTSAVNRIPVTSGNVDLSRIRSQFRPGDRIVIEVKKVVRRNFRNESEPVTVRNEIHQIPLQ